MAPEAVPTELVTVFTDDEDASTVFKFPDGSCTRIRDSRIISRSSVLSSFLGTEDITTVPLPQGYLQSWLQCVRFTALHETEACQISDGNTFVRLCQAADFFGDDTALDTMCKHISNCVFHSSSPGDIHPRSTLTESGIAQNRKNKHRQQRLRNSVQILTSLSQDLAVRVMHHCPLPRPLQAMLELLPPDIHHLVALALFPPASPQRILDLDCNLHDSSSLAALLKAPHLSSVFRGITVSGLVYQYSSSEQLLHGLGLCEADTATATELPRTRLPIVNASVHVQQPGRPAKCRATPDHMHADGNFWSILATHSSLTSLEISARESVQHSLSAALREVMQLTALKSLCIVPSSRMYCVPSALSALTELTRLYIVCSDDLHQFLLSCLLSLRNLRVLQFAPPIGGSEIEEIEAIHLNTQVPVTEEVEVPSVKGTCAPHDHDGARPGHECDDPQDEWMDKHRCSHTNCATTGPSEASTTHNSKPLGALSALRLSSAQLASCWSYLQHLKALRHLCIAHIDPPHIQTVCSFLSALTTLNSLSLETDTEQLHCLSGALRAANTIGSCTKLLAHSPRVDWSSCTETCRKLAPFKNLQNLTLVGSGVTLCNDSGALDEFARAMQHLTFLEHRVSYCPGLEFAEAVAISATSLKHIDLDASVIREQQQQLWLVSVAQLRNLQHLMLECRPCENLAQVPVALTQLTHFHLILQGGKAAQPAWCHSIVSTLAGLRNLHTLAVHDTTLYAVDSLLPALQRLTSLRSLQIMGFSSSVILKGIGCRKELTELVLWGGFFKGNWSPPLARTLAGLSELRVLKLSCRRSGNGFWARNVIQGLSALQRLIAFELACDLEGIQVLGRCLRNLELLQKLCVSFSESSSRVSVPKQLCDALMSLPKLTSLELEPVCMDSLPSCLIDRFSLGS